MSMIKQRRLALNLAMLSGGELISKVLAFAAFAYLARVLGPDGFGMVEFALAIVFVCNQVVDFGLDKYGAVQVARDRERASAIAAHIGVLRASLALATFAVLAVVVLLIDRTWSGRQLVLVYGLTLFATPGLVQWVFQGLDQMQWVALASMVRQFTFAAVVFLFVRTPHQLLAVALAEVLAVTAVIAFNVVVFRRQVGGFRLQFQLSEGVQILWQSLPICLSQIMMSLKLYLPAILLGLMLSSTQVGWFRATHRIVFAANTFIALYLLNLLPSIARSDQDGMDSLKHLMRISLPLSAAATALAGIAGLIFADPIIHLLYGPQYAEAAEVLKVMVWLLAAFLLGGHFRYILIGLGQQKLDLISTTVGAGFSVMLNLLLIPKYGLLAAAWTMLATEILSGLLAYGFVHHAILKKKGDYDPRREKVGEIRWHGTEAERREGT